MGQVFHRLQQSESLQLRWLRSQVRDVLEEGFKAGLDRMELIKQTLNASSARPLFCFPVLARAAQLVEKEVLAIVQGQQGHMRVVIDQGRDCMCWFSAP